MGIVDVIDAIPGKIREKRCKHNFVKHYSRLQNGYVRRCTKCGKVMKRAR